MSEEKKINNLIKQTQFVGLFPLNDMFNHKNPKKVDRSDVVNSGMQVTEAGVIRYNGKLKVNSTICKF